MIDMNIIKIITAFILFALSVNNNIYAQDITDVVTDKICDTTNSYPMIYECDSNVYFIITEKQAMEIDNNIELLDHIEIMLEAYAESDSVYIKVIDNLNNEKLLLNMKVSELQKQIKDKDKIINDLKLANSKLKEVNEKNEEIIANKDETIDNLEGIIRKKKIQNIVGYSLGSLAIVGVITLLIVK